MRYSLFITLLFAMAVPACLGDGPDPEEMQEVIKRGVKIEVDQFVSDQEKKCRDEAIETAVQKVDSLVRAGYLISRVDPVEKPPKPPKPGQPQVRTLPDSINMGLLREDSVKQEQ